MSTFLSPALLAMKERMKLAVARAREVVAEMESVGPALVMETDRGIGRARMYEGQGVSSVEVHLQVTEVPEVKLYDPPKVFDFLSGMEAIRDGKKMPDWSLCGEVVPFREEKKINSDRFKYNNALSRNVEIDYLYNPTNTETYLYPEKPVYYTGSVGWHEERKKDLQERGCKVLEEVPPGLGLASFDGYDGTVPLRFLMMVPHPRRFRQSYEVVETFFRAGVLEYRWQDKNFHRVSWDPALFPYVSTGAIDRWLGQKDRAYWLFHSGGQKIVPIDPTPSREYSPSFEIFVQVDGVWKDRMKMHGEEVVDVADEYSSCLPYLSRMTRYEKEVQLGLTRVDLDQVVIENRKVVPYEVFVDSRREIGSCVKSASEYTEKGLYVYVEGTVDGDEVTFLKGRVRRVPSTIVEGVESPVWSGPFTYMAVFLSEASFRRSFLEFSLSRMSAQGQGGLGYKRIEYPTGISLDIDTGESVTDVSERLARQSRTISTQQIVVTARLNQRLMLCPRFKGSGSSRQRFRVFMHPDFWLLTSDESYRVWEALNTHRRSTLYFVRKMAREEVYQWTDMLRRNLFLSYYERGTNAIHVVDLYSKTMTSVSLQISTREETRRAYYDRMERSVSLQGVINEDED